MIAPAELEARRIESGLTRSELATLTGITRGRIWDLENGLKRVGVVNAKRLAPHLGLQWTDFFADATHTETIGRTQEEQ